MKTIVAPTRSPGMYDRYSVYPGKDVYKVLGRSSPELNCALQCWSSLISEASATIEKLFRREDWLMMAECWRISQFDPSWGAIASMLAGVVVDGHRLRRVGDRFYKAEEVDGRVENLAHHLRSLDYIQSWAAILAVQFYLTHKADLTPEDAWWTLRFRAEYTKPSRKK